MLRYKNSISAKVHSLVGDREDISWAADIDGYSMGTLSFVDMGLPVGTRSSGKDLWNEVINNVQVSPAS